MWSRQQKQLKSKLHIDNDKWNKDSVKYVGGVDISTSLNDDGIACACFVILSYPELKVMFVWLKLKISIYTITVLDCAPRNTNCMHR